MTVFCVLKYTLYKNTTATTAERKEQCRKIHLNFQEIFQHSVNMPIHFLVLQQWLCITKNVAKT